MPLDITIPKPCHENWNSMAPDGQGRFCSMCAKTVVDFTAMPKDAVDRYLLANREAKICGRFNSSQLKNETATLYITREVLLQQTGFRNIFLLALLVCMGTTLLSCKDHEGQVVGRIKIPDTLPVTDTAQTGANPVPAATLRDAGYTDPNAVKPAPMALGEPAFIPVPDSAGATKN
jgi:hypothetical protein